MRITGPDYTDEDLIAPWDSARRQRRPNCRRDDPEIDDDRDERDKRDEMRNNETHPPAGEAMP
jgi:hypothetical protein